VHGLTAALLVATATLYALGVGRLWRRAGAGRGVTAANVACFTLAWLTVAGALLSPLHHLAEARLWAHMVQHELLMVVAAPLFILGRPLEAWAWGWRAGGRALFSLARAMENPVLAWTAHAAAVLLWHVPGAFGAALHDPWLHAAQHASFLVTGLMFWWMALARTAGVLGAVAALFTTMLYTGALGALMTFSRTAWYAGYALEDQQLAGLVMWVPAGLAYLAAALWVLSRKIDFAGP
jgi:putative membrane protein